tara:strand:- start:674 stop:1999 length:1326 start_codon:yes stop_codon:yes gene_type:complete
MGHTFNPVTDGTVAIETVLAEEANRIGADIHRQTIHTSPWMDLIRQTTFPDQSGGFLTTLVYDRAIPVSAAGGSTGTPTAGQVGADWTNVAASEGSGTLGTSTLDQPLPNGDTMATEVGPNVVAGTSFVHFGKKLKQYQLARAAIESPRISLNDMRFAAHRGEQLRAIMDLLTEATRYTWENRYRDEYARLSDGYVGCKTTGTALDGQDGTFEGDGIDQVLDLSAAGVAGIPDANISNAILDKCYFNLIRRGAGTNAYGRENGRPVFGLVISSEASYQLQTEAGFRDDVRYNNAAVSDLIAPLGIEKSFRGFYHLVDDLAPRFSLASTDQFTRIAPYTVSSGVSTYNSAYDSASYEAAFILHPDVMESQIPQPLSSVGSGVTFNANDYKGEFKWLNIPDAVINPDSETGFFRGILASASKPIKTDFGFMILFKRDSSTPAA